MNFDFVKYSDASAQSWLTKAAAGTVVTPDEHNALIASAAATTDTLIGLASAFQTGITDRAVYPRTSYTGSDPVYAGKDVPVVGFQRVATDWVNAPASAGQSWDGDQRMWAMAALQGISLIGRTWRFIAAPAAAGYIAIPSDTTLVAIMGLARQAIAAPPAGSSIQEQKSLGQRMSLVLKGAMDFRTRVIAFETTGTKQSPLANESSTEARQAASDWAQMYQASLHRGNMAATLGIAGIALGAAILPPLFGARMVRRPPPGVL